MSRPKSFITHSIIIGRGENASHDPIDTRKPKDIRVYLDKYLVCPLELLEGLDIDHIIKLRGKIVDEQ